MGRRWDKRRMTESEWISAVGDGSLAIDFAAETNLPSDSRVMVSEGHGKPVKALPVAMLLDMAIGDAKPSPGVTALARECARAMSHAAGVGSLPSGHRLSYEWRTGKSFSSPHLWLSVFGRAMPGEALPANVMAACPESEALNHATKVLASSKDARVNAFTEVGVLPATAVRAFLDSKAPSWLTKKWLGMPFPAIITKSLGLTGFARAASSALWKGSEGEPSEDLAKLMGWIQV